MYKRQVLDQAYHEKGHFTYPTNEDMRDEIWRVKRLGLNLMRIHIKPEDPVKLYWADKLGVMVMEDMPCFWGEPTPKARAAYEREQQAVLERDFNHPSIVSWVVFNETWGLFTGQGEEKCYLPETQAWVRARYRWTKRFDPTRLVEDNSPCNNDHVESDINSWHFYRNGYEVVRDLSLIHICMGNIVDLELDVGDGTVLSLIVPGSTKMLQFLRPEKDIIIPWGNIVKIGDDVILVKFDAFCVPRGRD